MSRQLKRKTGSGRGKHRRKWSTAAAKGSRRVMGAVDAAWQAGWL